MLDHAQVAAAFAEWDRRYREEPEKFMSEAEHLLRLVPQTYGDIAAVYFLSILNEQAPTNDQNLDSQPRA